MNINCSGDIIDGCIYVSRHTEHLIKILTELENPTCGNCTENHFKNIKNHVTSLTYSAQFIHSQTIFLM